jgi:rod shape-determining protein MreD
MYWFVLTTGVYLAAVVETSLADALAIGGIAPDLLALVLIVRLLFGPPSHQLSISFVLGLIADLTTQTHAGVVLAGFLATGWVISHYALRVGPTNVPWGVLTVLAAVSGMTLFTAVGLQVLGETDLQWSSVTLRSLGVGCYTAGFALPVFMVMTWLCEPAAVWRRA